MNFEYCIWKDESDPDSDKEMYSKNFIVSVVAPHTPPPDLSISDNSWIYQTVSLHTFMAVKLPILFLDGSREMI